MVTNVRCCRGYQCMLLLLLLVYCLMILYDAKNFLHLPGNSNLARLSLPVATEANPPNLRIAQRMRLEPAQLEGVEKRIQVRLAMRDNGFARAYSLHFSCFVVFS